MRSAYLGVAVLTVMTFFLFVVAGVTYADNNAANLQCVKEKAVTDKHGKKVTITVNYGAQCGKQEYDESDQLLWVGGKGCACKDTEHPEYNISGVCSAPLKCDTSQGTCGPDDLKCKKPTQDEIGSAVPCGGAGQDPCTTTADNSGSVPSATPVNPATSISPAEPCPSTGCATGNTGTGDLSSVPPATSCSGSGCGVQGSGQLGTIPQATPLNNFGAMLNNAYKDVMGDYLYAPDPGYVQPAQIFQQGDFEGWGGLSAAPPATPVSSQNVGGIYNPDVVPATPVGAYPALDAGPTYYGPTFGPETPPQSLVGNAPGGYPDVSETVAGYSQIGESSLGQYVNSAPVPSTNPAWAGQLGIDPVTGEYLQATAPSANNAWGPDPQWGTLAPPQGWEVSQSFSPDIPSGEQAPIVSTFPENGTEPYPYAGVTGGPSTEGASIVSQYGAQAQTPGFLPAGNDVRDVSAPVQSTGSGFTVTTQQNQGTQQTSGGNDLAQVSINPSQALTPTEEGVSASAPGAVSGAVPQIAARPVGGEAQVGTSIEEYSERVREGFGAYAVTGIPPVYYLEQNPGAAAPNWTAQDVGTIDPSNPWPSIAEGAQPTGALEGNVAQLASLGNATPTLALSENPLLPVTANPENIGSVTAGSGTMQSPVSMSPEAVLPAVPGAVAAELPPQPQSFPNSVVAVAGPAQDLTTNETLTDEGVPEQGNAMTESGIHIPPGNQLAPGATQVGPAEPPTRNWTEDAGNPPSAETVSSPWKPTQDNLPVFAVSFDPAAQWAISH